MGEYAVALFPTMLPEISAALGLLLVVGLLGFLTLYPILRAVGLDE